MKKVMKYLRVVRLLKREINTAFYMHYWGRAHNLCDRLNRIQGKEPQGRLAMYQRFKRGFVADLHFPGEWEFDKYSLS